MEPWWMRRKTVISLVLLFIGLAGNAARGGVVLFDGSLGTLPTAQGWLYLTDPFPASATQSAGGGVTTLDTTSVRADSAGYFSYVHPLVGTLDRFAGFSLSFDMKLLSESHVSTHRAGFSALVVTQDLKAIELGFWTNRVWAQKDSPLFTQGEGATIDTTAALVRYDLTILGTNYSLAANSAPLLSGALRDYSSFGVPYSVPSYVFLGDDTSSASAKVQLARIELAAVPEASSLALATLGVGGFVVFLARRAGLISAASARHRRAES